jgi:hypothetical protein
MTPGFLDSDPQSTARTSGGKVRISEIHWNIASISTHFLVVDAGLARAKAKDCETAWSASIDIDFLPQNLLFKF